MEEIGHSVSLLRYREAVFILYTMVLVTKMFSVYFTMEQSALLRHPFHSEVRLVAPMVIHLAESTRSLPRATCWTWAVALGVAWFAGVAAQQKLFHVSEVVSIFALVSTMTDAVIVCRAWLLAAGWSVGAWFDRIGL